MHWESTPRHDGFITDILEGKVMGRPLPVSTISATSNTRWASLLTDTRRIRHATFHCNDKAYPLEIDDGLNRFISNRFNRL